MGVRVGLRFVSVAVLTSLALACGGESQGGNASGSGGGSGGSGNAAGSGGGGGSSAGGAAGASCGCDLANANASCNPAGQCEISSCKASWSDCDGVAASGCEVDVDTDLANCGACGVVCPVAAVCTQGSCACACPTGMTNCAVNGCFCANTDVDPANCGACGVSCAVGESCVDGSCSGGTGCSAPTVGPEIVTGTPSWTALDWKVYAAPCGTQANNAYEFTETTKQMWAPNHVLDPVQNAFKCAVAHAPPYTSELASGLAAVGLTNSGCFPSTDWKAPKGIVISTLLVASASAPNDVSFETPSTSGPVIVFSSLSVDADLYRDGQLIDPYFDSTYVKAAALYNYQPPFDTAVGGYRHLPLNWAENDSFTGGVALGPGNYSFVVKLSEGGNATTQTISFVVQ